jgi:hypothetical protein
MNKEAVRMQGATIRLNKIMTVAVGLVLVALVIATAPAAHAALTYDSDLTQQINAGTLSTDVRDGSNAVVATPAFAMSPVSVSNSQQVSTGTFGSSTQRISVDNPGGANNGWTLSLGATTPATEKWVSGGNNYAFNGATPELGQLTLNPAAGTITPVVGTSAGITQGTSATFSGTSPITLLTAAAGSDDIWNGYLTGVGLSQTIPASQPGGSYSINMTQTVVAN